MQIAALVEDDQNEFNKRNVRNNKKRSLDDSSDSTSRNNNRSQKQQKSQSNNQGSNDKVCIHCHKKFEDKLLFSKHENVSSVINLDISHEIMNAQLKGCETKKMVSRHAYVLHNLVLPFSRWFTWVSDFVTYGQISYAILLRHRKLKFYFEKRSNSHIDFFYKIAAGQQKLLHSFSMISLIYKLFQALLIPIALVLHHPWQAYQVGVSVLPSLVQFFLTQWTLN